MTDGDRSRRGGTANGQVQPEQSVARIVVVEQRPPPHVRLPGQDGLRVIRRHRRHVGAVERETSSHAVTVELLCRVRRDADQMPCRIGGNANLWGAQDTFGIVFAFRWTGAALAAGVMAFPLMVRAIKLSIEAVDPRLEQAGATLGASRPWVFLTVTLPLILPGIIAGAILAFAKATGEFGATITFVSNIPGQTQTLPLAIYAFLQVPGGEASALRLVAISVAVAMAALLLSEVVASRVARRIGRA
jgi:hypothetical protein